MATHFCLVGRSPQTASRTRQPRHISQLLDEYLQSDEPLAVALRKWGRTSCRGVPVPVVPVMGDGKQSVLNGFVTNSYIESYKALRTVCEAQNEQLEQLELEQRTGSLTLKQFIDNEI
ncbi:MAG: hypothetical protein K6E73_09570 [Bacteroidales bacterium]|nr:hypothetical protein [Bacteroidales bacterium]